MKLNLNVSRRARVTAPLAALVASACLVAGVATPSLADSKDDIRKQQKQVDAQIKDAKADVHASSAKYTAAINAVERANAKLRDAQAKLGATQGQLAVAQARDAQLKRSLEAAQKNLLVAEQHVEKQAAELLLAEQVIEQFAVEQLLSGDRGLQSFSALVNGESPMVVSEQMALSASIGDAQVTQAQRVDAARVMLEVERQKLEVLRDEIAAQKAEAEQNVIVMQALAIQAEAERALVAVEVDSTEKAKKDAQSALAADRAAQAVLERESAQLKRDLQAIIDRELREANQGGGGSGGGGGGGGTGDSGGTLSRPVPGIVTSPYGWRVHPILGYRRMHDGTDFRAPCGTNVYAAAEGTIVSQFYSSGYGNRVVLNNGVKRGVSVMTTYNHLSRFAKSNGSHVKRGELIGYAGTTGMSTGCHLHFQVLVNGNHTNPMNWF